MQKIRCPQCGVINLEKFISYPQCAGCGSTLPQIQTNLQPLSFWRRPVKPLLWVSVVGLALGSCVWIASVFQIQAESQSQVVIYGDSSRRASVGQIIALNFRIDTIGESRRERAQPLRDVQLRIPLRIFQSLRFVSIDPPTDEMTIVGHGRYFKYKSLERETPIRLELRVARAGSLRLPVTAYAADQLPNDWRVKVTVLSPQKLPRAVGDNRISSDN